MDQESIDRLFREKLNGLEVAPSAEAWSQVEKKIHPNKTPIVYWVAASVTLLIISWVVWPKQEIESDQLLSEVDHPVMIESNNLVNPIAAELSEKKAVKIKEVNKTQLKVQQPVQTQLVAAQEPVFIDKSIDEIPAEELLQPKEETTTIVASEEEDQPLLEEVTEDPVKAETEEVKYSTVKITYIASSKPAKPVIDFNEEAQKTDSTNVLKKFIAFADKIDPGEMLADIKTAKDNLLRNGFKSKKDKNSMNP